MPEAPRKIPVRFFRTGRREPAREWLRSLDEDDRRIIGRDLMRVQFGWPIGMPLCRNIGGGLWELRSALSGNRIARVIFSFHDDTLVALHGFIKKTRRTPGSDIELARKRRREIEAESR
jgi:phage-related protein